MSRAALIGVDWGSSSVRAYRFAADGSVLAMRAGEQGASRLRGGPAAFEAALRDLLGDWLAASAPPAPVVACGMVGSAHGWREAPYVRCPAALDALHAEAVTAVGTAELSLRIVPGMMLESADGTIDVMRGEETQIAGLLQLHPALAMRASVIMPGTHSKWVELAEGRLVSFATRMTGELYAVLCAHSVLGRLMQPSTGFDGEAFMLGVETARRAAGADLAHQLFSVRTRGLFAQLAPAALGDYLSGLLIGNEIAAGLARSRAPGPLVLVGEAELCQRYARALEPWGERALIVANPVARGLWQIAATARWIGDEA